MPWLTDSETATEELKSVRVPQPCSCSRCQEMCVEPCWPTPEEAERLISEGYGDSLMVEYVSEEGGEKFGVLVPAFEGYEGKCAPHSLVVLSGVLRARCTFQCDGLCYLHDEGMKPLEGVLASCKGQPDKLRSWVASLWRTSEAQSLVAKWSRERFPTVRMRFLGGVWVEV